MRKEIEVKLKVSDFEKLKDKLIQMGCVLSEPIFQDDITFVDHNYGDYDNFQSGKNILRIRKSNNKYIFTLKQPQKNEMDSIERETEITDPEEFKEALILMGYRKAVEVRKVRVKTKYKDYEICLDNVEDLGYFVEVEKIVDTGDSELIQNELLEFLKTLGLNISERVFNGYDTLIYIKNKN